MNKLSERLVGMIAKPLLGSLMLAAACANAAPVVVQPGGAAGYMYFPAGSAGGNGGGGQTTVTGIGGVRLFKYTNDNDWTVEANGQACGVGCTTSSLNTGAGFVTLKSTKPIDWTDNADAILANGVCRQTRECQVWVDPNTSLEVRAYRYKVTLTKTAGANTFTSVTSSFAGQTESCPATESVCTMYRGVQDKTYTMNGSVACTKSSDGAQQTGSGTSSCTSNADSLTLALRTFRVNKVHGLDTNYEVHFEGQVCPASTTGCVFYGWGDNKTLSTPHGSGLSWSFGPGSWSAITQTSGNFNVADNATYEASSGFPFTVTRDLSSDRNYTLSYGGQNCPSGQASCNFIGIGTGITLGSDKSVVWKIDSGSWVNYGLTSPSFSVNSPSSVTVGSMPAFPCSEEAKQCTTLGEDAYRMAVSGSTSVGKYIGTVGGRIIVARPADIGARTWDYYGVVTGATSTSDSASNTAKIPASQAASSCTSLGAGWYLPARDELNLIWSGGASLRAPLGVNTTGTYYWSSTENSSYSAWIQRFSDGGQNTNLKNVSYLVRCVRSF